MMELIPNREIKRKVENKGTGSDDRDMTDPPKSRSEKEQSHPKSHRS